MEFSKFNAQCLGIAVEEWPHLLQGQFSYVDAEWGYLSPIPESNPLSRQVVAVDSDIYFRFKDVKLVKILRYVENKTSSTTGFLGYNGNSTSTTAKQ